MKILLEESLKKGKITKVKKNKVLKKIPETDTIFDNVNAKKEDVKSSSNNVVAYSIDDKATKLIGDLSEGGSSWIKKEALDHGEARHIIVFLCPLN